MTERILSRPTVGKRSAVLGSPVYLRQDVCAALPRKHFVFGVPPNTGGCAALATINDGASLLIEGELSRLSVFEGVTEGEITRGCCLHRGTDVY